MTTMQNDTPTTLVRFLRWLVVMDRRIIFALVGVVAVIFMTVDAGLPIPVSAAAQDMYNQVESLKPGDRVHMSIDYGPSSMAELYPQHLVILRQMLKKDVRVICSSLWADGPAMIDRAFRDVLAELEAEGIKKESGVDYVNLGYKPGDRVAIASIVASFKQTFPTDYVGRRTADLPIMQGWDTYDQGIALLMTIAVGDPGAPEYIQQAQGRMKVPMVAGVTAVISPQLYPFYQSKNLQGFLAGLAGAAEYETLALKSAIIAEPGAAIRGMNVQSAIHMLIVILVIIGNGAYFLLRLHGEKVR